jgi:hypothetical protein
MPLHRRALLGAPATVGDGDEFLAALANRHNESITWN